MPGIALVTGASRGIGKAIATRLARDGFRVVVNDIPRQRTELEEVKDLIGGEGRPDSSMAYVADVSVEAEVEAMIKEVSEKMGGLDVMVANAGILFSKRFTETSAEDFQRVLSVNTLGTFFCYKHAALQMIKQNRGGRIIGAASINSKQGAAMTSAYAVSKFGVRALTQSAALELTEHRITVNAYAPGVIETQMSQVMDPAVREDVMGYYQTHSGDAGTQSKVYECRGQPEDVAGLVSFLASKDSAHITGQTISVNGGAFFD